MSNQNSEDEESKEDIPITPNHLNKQFNQYKDISTRATSFITNQKAYGTRDEEEKVEEMSYLSK